METHDTVVAYCASILHQVARMIFPQAILNADRVYYHQTDTDQTYDEILCTILIHCVTTFLVWMLVSHVLFKYLVWLHLKLTRSPIENGPKVTWMLTHLFFNLFVTAITIREATEALLWPTTLGYSPPQWRGNYPGGLLAMSSTVSFHLYHMIFYYTQLTRENIVHHCANAFVASIGASLQPWGRFAAISALSLCGIPGVFKYVGLLLLTFKKIDMLAFKQLFRWVNLGVRLPLHIVGTQALFSSYFEGSNAPTLSRSEALFMWIFPGLNVVNAFYYCDQAIGSYYVTAYTETTTLRTQKGNDRRSVKLQQEHSN